MAHQSKKPKRTDDDNHSNEPNQQPSGPGAQNAKPIQLQRRRVWRACESCRRKKIKCDGCEPTCSQCQTTGSTCTWLQTKDRAALSRHYVQELEARLLHMETIFDQIAPVLEQLGPTANGVSIPSIASAVSTAMPSRESNSSSTTAPILRTIAPKLPSNSSGIKVEEDVSDIFGQLALDEYGHMRWIGGSSTMSLIQSFRTLTSSPLHRISPMEEDPQSPAPSVNKLYFPASVFFGKVRALPGPEEVEYPERDLADKLVDAYFTRFHFLMPILDKPSFLIQYENIMNNTHDTKLARTETAFISLVFAVFACSANLIQDPRLSNDNVDEGGMGMIYYERALILQYISHAVIQPSHVQCFVLLSSYLCSVNCLPQAWILMGQAVRSGQDLGLHRSPRRLLITPVEKETRRKIWWGVYTLDRMLALALGRPLGVNDADCDVEYPVDVDDINLPEYFKGANLQNISPSLMSGFTFLIKLYEIAGRVLREVYALDNCKDNIDREKAVELQQTVERLDGELTKWLESMPPVFKSEPGSNDQVSMGAILCSHYYSVLTTLHRNLVPIKKDQTGTPKSTVKAVASARSCIKLAPSMKNVVPPSHHIAFFIQHLFSSAVILLLYAMHMHHAEPRSATAAMEEAKSAIIAVESWEGSWPGARKCKELLIELTKTANEAIAKGSSETPSNPPVRHERRRSVTIANVNIPPRTMKNRSRRPHSRDPVTATRRMAAVSPYRVDNASRARSSSRKRGHDESEVTEGPSPITPYFQSFSSPTNSVRNGGNSSTSSPASGNVPSPALTMNNDFQEASPTVANASNYYGSPRLSSSSIPLPSPRYDYDYSMQSSMNQRSQWGTNSLDQNPLEMYTSNSQDSNMGYNAPYEYGSNDMMYPSYESPNTLGNSLGELSSSPPGSSFAATGLPFRGLEFIKNYNANGGYSMNDPDVLWQSYDPGAFEYVPEIPFSLGDLEAQESNR